MDGGTGRLPCPAERCSIGHSEEKIPFQTGKMIFEKSINVCRSFSMVRVRQRGHDKMHGFIFRKDKSRASPWISLGTLCAEYIRFPDFFPKGSKGYENFCPKKLTPACLDLT
jgi:hypothetical protein